MNKTQYEIGRACFKVRKKAKLTLLQFSYKTGFTVKALSAFENGRSSNYNILLEYLKLDEELTKGLIGG